MDEEKKERKTVSKSSRQAFFSPQVGLNGGGTTRYRCRNRTFLYRKALTHPTKARPHSLVTLLYPDYGTEFKHITAPQNTPFFVTIF